MKNLLFDSLISWNRKCPCGKFVDMNLQNTMFTQLMVFLYDSQEWLEYVMINLGIRLLRCRNSKYVKFSLFIYRANGKLTKFKSGILILFSSISTKYRKPIKALDFYRFLTQTLIPMYHLSKNNVRSQTCFLLKSVLRRRIFRMRIRLKKRIPR